VLKNIIRKYWKKNTLAFFLTSFESGGIILSTVYLAKIMNSLIERDASAFIYSFLLSLTAWAVALLFGFTRLRYMEKIKQEQLIEMRYAILKKIENASYLEFHEKNPNEYISWLTNDMNFIEEQGLGNFYSGMSSATLLLFSSIAILNFHWLLLAVSIVLSVLMFFIPKLFKQRLDERNKMVSSTFEQYISKVDEWIKGFDTLLSYNRTQLISKKLYEVTNKVKKEKIKLKNEKSSLYTLIRLSSVFAQYGIVLMTGLMILAQQLSAGTIFAIGDLTGNFFGNTSFFIDEITNFLSAISISNKMDDFRSQEKVDFGELPYAFEDRIVVENLTYTYEEKIVKIPDMVFEKGKKYAIIGKSGSGKSTFLNILAKNLKDYCGKILIDSCSLKDIQTQELKAHLSYVPQKSYIFDMSLSENIHLENNHSKYFIDKVIEDMNLTDKQHLASLGAQGGNISGGQAQRVELARAMLHARDLLIIDEGTSSLDPRAARIIEEKILTDEKLTVIFVTHHLNTSLKHHFEEIYSF